MNDFGDDTIFNTTDLTLRSYTEDPFATYVFESPASAKTPPEGSDLGLNNAENLVNQRGTQGLISPEPTTDSPTLKHVILNSDRPESSDSQILQSQSRSEVVEYKASRPPKVPEGWKAKWNEFYEEWYTTFPTLLTINTKIS